MDRAAQYDRNKDERYSRLEEIQECSKIFFLENTEHDILSLLMLPDPNVDMS